MYTAVSIALAMAVNVAVDVTVDKGVVITGFGDIFSTKCLWDLLFLILLFLQILLSDMLPIPLKLGGKYVYKQTILSVFMTNYILFVVVKILLFIFSTFSIFTIIFVILFFKTLVYNFQVLMKLVCSS